MSRRNASEPFELIAAMPELSQLEAGRLPIEIQQVHLPELLTEIRAEIQDTQERSNIDFEGKIEADLPLLQTDPGKLKIVLKNLLSNAIKFTEQGHITIEVRRDQRGVEISVSDTGIGIPQEALSLIVDPFRQVDSSATRQYRGTGLGLHIVKHLLDTLSGEVRVESVVGQGSTFHVKMPTLATLPTRDALGTLGCDPTFCSASPQTSTALTGHSSDGMQQPAPSRSLQRTCLGASPHPLAVQLLVWQ